VLWLQSADVEVKKYVVLASAIYHGIGQKQDKPLPFHWKLNFRLPFYLLMLRAELDRATHKKIAPKGLAFSGWDKAF